MNEAAKLWKTVILVIFSFWFFYALLSWSPWLTPVRAEQRAITAFEKKWQGVIDGCGFHCTGCGVTDTQKLPFGYLIEITYACGMLPADSPEYHQKSTLIVDPFFMVHGLPTP